MNESLLTGISVVIPVFNSQNTLFQLVNRLLLVLKARNQRFEIIFVNDGSMDSSWDVITKLAQQHPVIRGFNLGTNFGQHNALLAGIREARFDTLVTLDDDLQNPPEEIPKLLANLTSEIDVVYGAREKEQHGIWRNLASQTVKLSLTYFLGVKTARKSSAFRVFRTNLRNGFLNYQCDFISIDVLLSWVTNRFASVTVAHHLREVGKSNYSPARLYRHAFNMLTGFTTLPLQLASAIGLLFTAFGGLILAYVLVNFFVFRNQVPGFTFLASIISIFSGAILFSIGIVGEYLARMYSRTLQKPAYFVRETTTESKESLTFSEIA